MAKVSYGLDATVWLVIGDCIVKGRKIYLG